MLCRHIQDTEVHIIGIGGHRSGELLAVKAVEPGSLCPAIIAEVTLARGRPCRSHSHVLYFLLGQLGRTGEERRGRDCLGTWQCAKLKGSTAVSVLRFTRETKN